MKVCCDTNSTCEVKWEDKFVWEVLWFDSQRDLIFQVVSMGKVLEKKLKWLNFDKNSNQQDLEEVVMEIDLICYSQSTDHSNEEMMKYYQKILSIDSMINRDIEVEWVCWFDLRCVWFDLNWDSNVWDLRDNTILMEWRRVCCHSMRDVSVLSSSTLLMESFQSWGCSTPTLQLWSNSSFSKEI
jgi:hypothetical protein